MTRLLNALALAMAELRRNWTRTTLTSLGIVIGVASVIAMVGVGQGATASVEQDLASMGNNLLFVQAGADEGPHRRTSARPFKYIDVERIAREVPHLKAVAPNVGASADLAWGAVTTESVEVVGSSEAYLVASGWTLDEGRNLTSAEARSGAGVCVLGQTVVTELFGGLRPLGETLRIGRASCIVIGTLVSKGTNTMGMDQDDLVIAPWAFVQRRIAGTTDITSIYVSVDDEKHLDATSMALDATLRRIRHVTSDSTVDFNVRDTREMAETMSGITNVLTGFLAAVAGVSLLVGGIGIMNIMLVSVTERTREIGIRMSIGALEEDVLLQFLTEATVLSALGGVVGAVLGIAITAVVSLALGVPFVVEYRVVVASVLFSAAMGIGFGWMPARRAARLEPIDALRS